MQEFTGPGPTAPVATHKDVVLGVLVLCMLAHLGLGGGADELGEADVALREWRGGSGAWRGRRLLGPEGAVAEPRRSGEQFRTAAAAASPELITTGEEHEPAACAAASGSIDAHLDGQSGLVGLELAALVGVRLRLFHLLYIQWCRIAVACLSGEGCKKRAGVFVYYGSFNGMQFQKQRTEEPLTAAAFSC